MTGEESESIQARVQEQAQEKTGKLLTRARMKGERRVYIGIQRGEVRRHIGATLQGG